MCVIKSRAVLSRNTLQIPQLIAWYGLRAAIEVLVLAICFFMASTIALSSNVIWIALFHLPFEMTLWLVIGCWSALKEHLDRLPLQKSRLIMSLQSLTISERPTNTTYRVRWLKPILYPNQVTKKHVQVKWYLNAIDLLFSLPPFLSLFQILIWRRKVSIMTLTWYCSTKALTGSDLLC